MEGGNGGGGPASSLKQTVQSGLRNERFIQLIQVLGTLAAAALFFLTLIQFLFKDTSGISGLLQMALTIYQGVFAFVMTATELSMASGHHSLHGNRIVAMLPFLRRRYGRPIAYMLSALMLWFFTDPNFLVGLSLNVIQFYAIFLAVFSALPENPMDYRGFQRPQGQDDFLSRVQQMSAQSFDTMAASYISLSSSSYLENQLTSESQAMQDSVLRAHQQDLESSGFDNRQGYVAQVYSPANIPIQGDEEQQQPLAHPQSQTQPEADTNRGGDSELNPLQSIPQTSTPGEYQEERKE